MKEELLGFDKKKGGNEGLMPICDKSYCVRKADAFPAVPKKDFEKNINEIIMNYKQNYIPKKEHVAEIAGLRHDLKLMLQANKNWQESHKKLEQSLKEEKIRSNQERFNVQTLSNDLKRTEQSLAEKEKARKDLQAFFDIMSKGKNRFAIVRKEFEEYKEKVKQQLAEKDFQIKDYEIGLKKVHPHIDAILAMSNEQLAKKDKQIAEADEIVLDMLWQSCGNDDGEIDNLCMSPYEWACCYLFNKGKLKKKNDRIYFLNVEEHMAKSLKMKKAELKKELGK